MIESSTHPHPGRNEREYDLSVPAAVP